MKTSYRYTRRWKNRANIYHDAARMRFVVYRRANGIERRTSVRYWEAPLSWNAFRYAQTIARKLQRWPAKKLRSFKFPTQ